MAVLGARALSLAIAGLLAMALAGGAARADDDITLQQKINACHAIGDRDTRIACYDRLAEPVSSALPMSPIPQASPVSASPSLAVNRPQPTSAVASAAPAPAPSLSPQPVALPQTSESLRSKTDEIVIAISSVSRNGNNFSLVTSDGITWDQTDDRRIRQTPAPGDLMKISRGYLGYMCEFNRHLKFRCKPPYGLNGKMNLK